MKPLKHIGYAVIALLGMAITPAFAQTLDEAKIQQIVKDELTKLLNAEGTLDSAIQKGIKTYVDNQRKMAEQSKAQQKEQLAKNLPAVDTSRDHILGSVDAPITLVEYSDFECPFCKRFHPTVDKLIANNSDKVRWVYRHFPLGFHNPGAQKQAEASECAAKIGGNEAFWKYSDLIYQRTKSNGKGFPIANLEPLAKEIGLDADKFKACYDSGEMTARVNQDVSDGKKLGIAGTPAAFITNANGDIKVVSGALPLDKLQAMVDELIK